jgi:hypothetical protein
VSPQRTGATALGCVQSRRHGDGQHTEAQIQVGGLFTVMLLSVRADLCAADKLACSASTQTQVASTSNHRLQQLPSTLLCLVCKHHLLEALEVRHATQHIEHLQSGTHAGAGQAQDTHATVDTASIDSLYPKLVPQ